MCIFVFNPRQEQCDKYTKNARVLNYELKQRCETKQMYKTLDLYRESRNYMNTYYVQQNEQRFETKQMYKTSDLYRE